MEKLAILSTNQIVIQFMQMFTEFYQNQESDQRIDTYIEQFNDLFRRNTIQIDLS